MRKRIVAGNWKMNLNVQEARMFFDQLFGLSESNIDVIVAPPFVYLSEFSKNIGSIKLAAQTCSEFNNGAYTGDVSAEMLKSLGVSFCIIGHSERRMYHKETEAILKNKVDKLYENGIVPIYCCGESLEEREGGKAFEKVKMQIEKAIFHLTPSLIKDIIIAYEPIWAIGTGVTATTQQAQEMHAYIRSLIDERYGSEVAQKVRILYGGSVKSSNSKELFAQTDIDGGLIGGASLNFEEFTKIIES